MLSKIIHMAAGVFGVMRLKKKLNEGVQDLEIRAEILQVEWQLMLRRWILTAIWSLVAAVALFMTALVVTLLVVAFFWDTGDRLTALLGVGGFWVLLSCLAVFFGLRTARSGQPPFEVSRSLFKRQWRQWRRHLGN